MGYILPVENYQSQHYQNRVNQPERDPMPIDRIYPKRIETTHNVLVNRQMQQSPTQENSTNSNQQPTQQQRVVSDYEAPIYAELTGVGGQINHYV